MTSSHTSPPDRLDRDLELDPGDWQVRDTYFVLTGMVIPRPIGWVSTLSSSGTGNLAPYSFFNAVSSDPPHVVFASQGRKDSVRNIEETGEFVCNIVTLDVVEPMNFTSTDFPQDENEFKWAGLTAVASSRVAPPRVAEARAHLECKAVQIVPVGNSQLVIGEVVHIHVAREVWSDGRIDPEKLGPVCRLAGNYYAELGKVFKVERPYWKDVESTRGTGSMPKRTD